MRTTSGHLIIWGFYMELKAQQASLNIDEQIENLKSLGLIIGDEEYAKKILNDISYFRVIYDKQYNFDIKKEKFKLH